MLEGYRLSLNMKLDNSFQLGLVFNILVPSSTATGIFYTQGYIVMQDWTGPGARYAQLQVVNAIHEKGHIRPILPVIQDILYPV